MTLKYKIFDSSEQFEKFQKETPNLVIQSVTPIFAPSPSGLPENSEGDHKLYVFVLYTQSALAKLQATGK